MSSRSTEERFERFRRGGDPSALAEVFDRTAPEILRVALHVTGSPVEAEDLLQTTFLEAIECAGAYDGKRKIVPWLLGILTNQARLLRRREERSVDEQRLPRRSSEDPLATAQGSELSVAVEEAILALPEPYQPVLVLSLRHGLNSTEIAHALRRPAGTVRSQLTRGMELLRKALPSGFAVTALALAMPVRGLAAVREVVLERAVAHAALSVVPPAAVIAGGILVKKPLMAAAVSTLIVAAFGWFTFRPFGDLSQTPDPSEAAPAFAASSRPKDQSPVLDTASAAEAASRQSVRASQQESVGSLLVRVRWGEDGEPAEGIRVVWAPWDVPDGSLRSREALTSKNGTVLFEELVRGRCGVEVDRGKGASSAIKPGERVELDLRIDPGATMEGSVRDAEGRPIPGAEVLLSEESDQSDGRLVAMTGPEGTYRARSIPLRGCLAARAPGFVPSHARQVLAKLGKTVTVDFTLSGPALVLQGLVVDPDGKPVNGASVLVGWAGSGGGHIDGKLDTYPPSFWLRTDAGGRFPVDGVWPRGFPLWVRAPGFALSKTIFRGPIDPGTPVLVRLSRGATVRGRVTDETGRPWERVHFRAGDGAMQAPSWAQPTSVSDEDGTFILEGITAGAVSVEADARAGTARTTVEARDGQVVEWNPIIPRGLAIRGVVVDERGAPIPELGLDLLKPAEAQYQRNGSTDREGRFSFEGCVAGVHRIRVSEHKFAALLVEGIEPGEKDHRITLPDAKRATASITATILDQNGDPLEKSKVWVMKEPFGGGPLFFTDEDTGILEVTPLTPGRYRLDLWAEGHPRLDLGEHALAPSQRLDLGTVRLTKPAFLTIEAQRADQQPIQRSVAYVFNEQGKGVFSTVIPPRGHRSKPLEAGRYVVKCWGKDGPPLEREIDLLPGDESTIIFELPPCVLRTVRFVKPTKNMNLENLDVTWYDPSGKRILEDKSANWPGEMVPEWVRCFTRGSWRVEAVSDQGLRGSATITIADLSVREETIEIPLR